jgi:parvulin-like peptidyl-prolyl isomerase
MNVGRAASLALAALAPLALLWPQEPGPGRGLPAGAAALIDGEPISLEEYKDYLLAVSGRRPLEELVYRRLLEREAGRLGLDLDPAAPERDFEAAWAAELAKHEGDLARAEAELAEAGLDYKTYRSRYLAYARAAQLEQAVCSAARSIDEAEIRARFERDFGTGGARVEAAHILVARATARAEIARAGARPEDLSPESVERRVRERIGQLRVRALAGEDFASLARAHSHDLGTRESGGRLADADLARYGPALAESVRAAAVGEIAGPVSSEAGLHLVCVLARTETRLDDVRGELERALRAEPPSPAERKRLRERLFSAAEISM